MKRKGGKPSKQELRSLGVSTRHQPQRFPPVQMKQGPQPPKRRKKKRA